MKHFVHFFIGKEFSNMVFELGKFILKYNKVDNTACINHFLINSPKESNMEITPLLAYHIEGSGNLTGFDKQIKVEWDERSLLNNNTDLQENLTKFYIRNVFNKVLTANNRENSTFLHVFLHFPLYKPEAVETVKLFYNCIKNSGKPTKTDFIGYADDLADIIETEFKVTTPAYKQILSFSKFREEKKLTYDEHFIVIQNSLQSGISLGLNLETLTDVIGRFLLLCAEYYDEIFPNMMDYRDVFSFGFSTLCLDKYLFVKYLLGRTVLNSMDKAEVNKREVNVNIAGNIANELLNDRVTILSKYYSQIDDDKVKISQTADFHQIQQTLDEEVNKIIEKTGIILLNNKSITTKSAIIAAILGTNCELFSQSIFNENSVNIEDLYNESIDYFIENNKDSFYSIADEPPFNPITELKKIRQKMINSSADIRDLESKLVSLKKQISDTQKVEDCYIEDGYFHFQDKKFRLLPQFIEDPLEETYAAHPVTIPSIDLRKRFNVIKNQGQQGSCLAFSVTSIFEYILKLNQAKEYDLSEAFLYYNARELDDTGDVSVNTDTGSRFKPAMQSLAKFGIALEKFCQYDDNVHDRKPNDEAYQDALKRRLIKARNVNRVINDIKSALSDGFPIAISLNLCPSFKNAVNGFIPMPDEKEIEEFFLDETVKDKHSCHAMVITGFSDTLKMFIVRNSWGIEWGDNGYCYVPYSYIANEKLCNFSCIITEVESYSAKLEHIPSLKIDETDLNIRYIITKNQLDEKKVELNNMENKYSALRKYFEELKQLFFDSNNKDKFIEQAEERLTQEYENLNQERPELNKKKENELKEFDWETKKILLKLGLTGAGSILLFVLLNVLFGWINIPFHINYWWLISVLVVIGGIFAFKNNSRWENRREIKDKFDRQLRNLDSKIKGKEKELENFKIKVFCAWSLLKSVDKVQVYFQKMYANFISLVNNLRLWYKEIAESKKTLKLDTPNPNISLLDESILDGYFENKLKDNKDCEIDFCDSIENHEITEEYLRDYKEKLINRISEILLKLPSFADFNISSHIITNNFSDIAKKVTPDIIEKIDSKSVLFLHTNSKERGVIPVSKNVFAPDINAYEGELRKKCSRIVCVYHNSDDKYRFILLKTSNLSISECKIFENYER